jgi:hypothetical protein
MEYSHYWEASPGVLSLASNEKAFPWPWDSVNMPSPRSSWEDAAVRIGVEVAGLTDLRTPARSGRPYHSFAYDDGDVVQYTKPLGPRFSFRLRADGLSTGAPTLRVSPAYRRLVRYRFMNLHGPNYIAADIACVALLGRGYAPLHASSFALGSSVFVIAAPPNMGKTLTVLLACEHYQADFLSEDLLITDGWWVHPVPWTSTYRYYNVVAQDEAYLGQAVARLGTKLRNRLPVLDVVGGAKLPITAYFPNVRIPNRAAVTHLIFLERGPALVQSINDSEALKRLWNLNRFEFWYTKSPLLHAYDYFLGGDFLSDRLDAERDIVSRFSGAAAERLVVRVDDPHDYLEAILSHVA